MVPYERNLLQPDGKIVTVRVHEQLIRNKRGRTIGLRSASLDVTDHQRTQDGVKAPIEVRLLYKGLTGYDAEHSTISCALNQAGQVVALSATPVRAAGSADPASPAD